MPYRFLFSAIWQPVYGQKWNLLLKAALTGWEVTTLTTLESGNRYFALNYSGSSANNYNGPDLLLHVTAKVHF